MFKFVLVKADYLGPTDNSYWALFIENLEDLFSYFEVKTPQLLQAYWEIKSKAIKGIEGHFTSIEQKAIAPLFERPNKNKTLTDDVLLIDDKLNQPKLKAVLAGHKLLINPSGIGFCFYDEKYHTLLERRSSTTFVLPEDKDIIVKQWPNGKHWYVRVGNYDLPDKYPTYEEGVKAGDRYLKEAK